MMPATGCSGVLCTCPKPSNISQEESSGKIQSLVILYTFVYFELFIPTSMCDFCDKKIFFLSAYIIAIERKGSGFWLKSRTLMTGVLWLGPKRKCPDPARCLL